MRSILHRALWAITVLLLFPPSLFAASAKDTLTLGVFPYISASQMMERLTPLAKRMEEALGKRIILVSAPDFTSFVERTANGEYDLVLTGPHMGLLAEQRDGWQRVAQTGQKIATVLLVRKESTIQRLEDLRGKKITISHQKSLTYLLAEKALTEKGIIMGKDMKVIETATFPNIMQSILLGEADVGATPVPLWDNLEYDNAEQYNQLREIYRSQSAAPSILVMAHPRTDPATIDTLRESLIHFQETPEGKIFFKKNLFESFLPIDDASMESAAPFVHVLMPPR